MNGLAHAKAPWRIDRSGWRPDGTGRTVIRDADGWDIVHMGGAWNNAQANEALVAAAPDLAAVLREVADFWAGGDAPQALTDKINAALAKAGV